MVHTSAARTDTSLDSVEHGLEGLTFQSAARFTLMLVIRKEDGMEEQRYSLCPNCDACPEVVVTGEKVVIGEPGNQVHLTPSEWNVLVEGVRSGRLRSVGGPGDDTQRCACGCERC